MAIEQWATEALAIDRLWDIKDEEVVRERRSARLGA
jgi:hypothetical protein